MVRGEWLKTACDAIFTTPVLHHAQHQQKPVSQHCGDFLFGG